MVLCAIFAKLFSMLIQYQHALFPTFSRWENAFTDFPTFSDRGNPVSYREFFPQLRNTFSESWYGQTFSILFRFFFQIYIEVDGEKYALNIFSLDIVASLSRNHLKSNLSLYSL